MKKLIITAACAAMAISGFAQGTVQFKNSVLTEFYLGQYASGALTGSGATTTAAIGTQTGSLTPTSTGIVDVGLFWSTSAFSTAAAGTLAGIEGFNATFSTVAGQLNAGNTSFGINGTSAGQTGVYLQIFAWDNSYGDTQAGLEACIAAGGYFGAATAGAANTTYGAIGAAQEVTLGQASPANGTLIFGTTGSLFGKTILLAQQTPEPTTIALGGLGAAALLLFRRRK